MNAIVSAAQARRDRASGRLCFWRRRAPDAASQTASEAALLPAPDVLVARYRDIVFAYAVRRVADPDEAEDVSAEVFAAAFAGAPRRLDWSGEVDGDPVRAWLLGIARRKVADVQRNRARQRRRGETGADATNAPDAPASRPEPLLLRGEAATAVRALVDGLKPDQREALLLKYVEELSLAEIARILNRSPQAVSSLLQRARATAFARGQAYFAPQTENEERTQTP